MIDRRIIIISLAATMAAVFAYMLFWGSLFPFSPVNPGFDQYESDRVIVRVQHGADFEEYGLIDSLLPSVEEFHGLRFTRKPVVFIFRDQTSFNRRSVSRARFCAFPNGTLVVAPRALDESRQGIISLETYLTHELSHALLYQHMSLLQAYRYPRWLLEGIAMCGADQMGTSWYPDRAETYAMIARGNFMPPEVYATPREDNVVLDVPEQIAFIYSEFGCLVEYLICRYGRERFFGYVVTLLDRSDHDRVFSEVFGNNFDRILEEFRAYAVETAAGEG